MNSTQPAFGIDFLDHVAIKVGDMEKSVEWYEQVLGLKRYTFEAWGSFPVFLLAGKTGVAIFPKKGKEFTPKPAVRIDHFAFQVDLDNFRKAQKHFDALGIPFELQDHTYFHSIYLRDPDGHQVELTTLVVAADKFYQESS